MERVDVKNTLIVVTGSNIVAEDRDRPLAYYLKTEIDKRGDGKFRRAIVVSDLLYLFSEKLQECATIVVGGPKVNILSQMLYRDVPLAITVEEKIFVHVHATGRRVIIYGWDYESTHHAVRLFVDSEQLDRLLEQLWKDSEEEAEEAEEEPGEETEEEPEEPWEDDPEWGAEEN